MSSLLSRIMLAIFLLPAAAVIYFGCCVIGFELPRRGLTSYGNRDTAPFLLAGAITSGFVVVYWTLLWRGTILWTTRRLRYTLYASAGSIVLGVFAWLGMYTIERDVAAFFGTAVMPIAWLLATSIVWRETAGERAARSVGVGSIACPNCGYNLTGLRGTRCPECGQEFTLEALLAAQTVTVTSDLA